MHACVCAIYILKWDFKVKDTIFFSFYYPVIGLEDHHLAGYQYGGLRPHHPSEHVRNPNALVSHMHEVSILSKEIKKGNQVSLATASWQVVQIECM